MRLPLVILCVLYISACAEQKLDETYNWDDAQWMWHPDVSPMATNRFTYFLNEFEYDGRDAGLKAYFAADATARLYINGEIVRRKVTRYHPSKVRPEEIQIDKYLKLGTNEILIMHHNWGNIKNFQRNEIRRGGLLFFAPLLPALQSGWKTAEAKHFAHHEQQIIGVIGDLRIRFPLIIDGTKMSDKLDWKDVVIVQDGPWALSHEYYPKAQSEEFIPVQSVIAAGNVKYGDAFSANPDNLSQDIKFPDHMEQAEYRPEPQKSFELSNFIKGKETKISLKAGETVYATFDLYRPIHGYPAFEVETDTPGVALSFGYGELNYSLYDGSNHVDPVTGWVKTEGVVGDFYGDRYLTSGKGLDVIEIPDERTARYMTVHFTAPQDALGDTIVKLSKLGIVKSQYPVDWVGSFDADDKIIDQIIELSKTHAEITMSDVYIDTPGREDGQWLEDIRLRALIAESWIGDTDLRYLTLAHTQESHIDGKFLSFAPQSFIDLTNWDWGMQWITILHDHLKWIEMTDDGSEKAYYFSKALITYVDLLLGQLNEQGLFASNEVFADIRVGPHMSSPDDVSVITHAWLIERLQQAIDIAYYYNIDKADIIGWIAARDKMIEGFHKYLVIDGYAADVLFADGRLEGKSQASQLSVIQAGLFDADKSRELIAGFFNEEVGRAPAGITPWNNPTYLYRALKTLSDNGLGERAMRHFKWRMSPYLPGSPDNLTPLELQGPYGGPLPEYFVRHEDIGLSSDEINTAQPGDPTGSHGWAAVGMVWLHDSVLGVRWGSGGFDDKTLSISPNMYGLNSIDGEVITPWGKVFVGFKDNRLEINIPEGVRTRINLPESLSGAICHETPLVSSKCKFVDDRTIHLEDGGRYILLKEE
jgi:hypothetical protein